jgi:hypothetical protein
MLQVGATGINQPTEKNHENHCENIRLEILTNDQCVQGQVAWEYFVTQRESNQKY